MPDCSNFLDNNGQQEAYRWAKSLTRETFASNKQHVIIQVGWLIVIITFNSIHHHFLKKNYSLFPLTYIH